MYLWGDKILTTFLCIYSVTVIVYIRNIYKYGLIFLAYAWFCAFHIRGRAYPSVGLRLPRPAEIGMSKNVVVFNKFHFGLYLSLASYLLSRNEISRSCIFERKKNLSSRSKEKFSEKRS